MEKKKEKSECYYVKIPTFRRTVEVRIGGSKEEFDSMNTGFDYNLTGGFYFFDEENNCNVIWLRDYDLSVLVHELVHCVEGVCEQCGLEMKGEPIAYIYQELFCRIWSKCGERFKIDEDTKWFFKQ